MTEAVESDAPSNWQKRVEALENDRDGAISPGFQIAAPRFADGPALQKKSVSETSFATFRQGLTGTALYGFSFDQSAVADPDFVVNDFMRPQDYRYPVQASLSKNLEEWQRFQNAMDARDHDYSIMQARPFQSALVSFADPTLIGLDLASFGLAHLATVPLMANTIGRTVQGAKIAERLRYAPRLANILEQGAVGAGGAVISTLAQEGIKSASDELYQIEDLGTHVLFSSMIGMALGGAVGLLGKTRVKAIESDFIEGFRVGKSHL